MAKNKVASKPINNSFLVEIRQAISDYIATEGCSCCQDKEGHQVAMERLGRLLKMKKYSDGSGFDYGRYRSK